jgi:hypothetical protein
MNETPPSDSGRRGFVRIALLALLGAAVALGLKALGVFGGGC